MKYDMNISVYEDRFAQRTNIFVGNCTGLEVNDKYGCSVFWIDIEI